VFTVTCAAASHFKLSLGCVYGTCDIPFGCDCLPGWKGPLCNQAICTEGCNTEHGECRSTRNAIYYIGKFPMTGNIGFSISNNAIVLAPQLVACAQQVVPRSKWYVSNGDTSHAAWRDNIKFSTTITTTL